MAKCFVFELFFFTVDRNEIFPNIVEEILEKFLNVEQNVKCFKHDEPCLYFCIKDEAAICLQCWLEEKHRGHQVVERLKVARAEKAQQLQDIVKDYASFVLNTIKEAGVIEDVRNLGLSDYKEAKAKVRNVCFFIK